jgi:hypothetical protein
MSEFNLRMFLEGFEYWKQVLTKVYNNCGSSMEFEMVVDDFDACWGALFPEDVPDEVITEITRFYERVSDYHADLQGNLNL